MSSSLTLYSQNEASKWFFGEMAAIDFATSPPTVINGSSMNTVEGCASICTPAGSLLFYTDGVTIWNQANTAMANGTGLLGNQSSTQASIIVKKPGSSNLYYVFTTDNIGGPNGLRYSVVDMSLAAGMGSVTVKNVQLYAPTTEKLTAVRHCNGIDTWVLTHEVNTNNFVAHLVTAGGIGTSVITSIGSVHVDYVGGMKFSPNGKKLGVCVSDNSNALAYFELYDFNNITGVMSNSLSIGPYGVLTYQCEFSPDGTKFYGTLPVGQIRQFELCAGSNAAILASEYTFTTNAAWGIQLAPNGKIYTSGWGDAALGVINNPNLAGAACNYVPAALSVGNGTCMEGLPNFNNSFFKEQLAFTYTVDMALSCKTASFTAPPQTTLSSGCTTATNYNSLSWNFGNPSGAATSTLSNPVHVYNSPGTYTVTLILNSTCTSDTIRKVISIINPTVSVSGPASLCSGQTATITASGAGTYTWSNAINNASIVVSPTVTSIYTATSTSTSGDCSSFASATISVLTSPTLSISGNFNICSGSSTTLNVSGVPSASWSSNGGNNLSAILSPTITSFYTVIGTAANGCASSKVVTVTVNKCTGINEQTAEGKIRLYPNPNSSYLMVETPLKIDIVITDLAGKIIHTQQLEGNGYINISNFVEGIYILKTIQEDQSVEMFRFVKEE